jgi:hypothetical protein
MMAVDNFKQIADDIIRFDSPNEFYFVQIIRRAKDAPYIGSNNQFIKAYAVYSIADLMDKRARIVDLCHRLDARAYIHPAPRNDRTIALMMLEELAVIIRTEQYQNTRNLWSTMCGRYSPPKGKKLWLIDRDNDTGIENNTIVRWLEHEKGPKPEGPKVKTIIPTKNGSHIITIPFDLQWWLKMYEENKLPFIDIHKNNPTVLYCP